MLADSGCSQGLVQVVHDAPAQVLPVVESGPFPVPIIQVEPERSDQPQHRPDRHAGPPDRPDVRRDLGLIEYDVNQGLALKKG